jgi:hypothetical protein
MYSSTAGTGLVSASAGSHMRAARRQPSFNVIQKCSMVLTLDGNDAGICMIVAVLGTQPNSFGDPPVA